MQNNTCGDIKIDDISKLYIEFAKILNSDKYIYISYKDFCINWLEGFSISNFSTYPLPIIANREEISQRDIVVIPLELKEHNNIIYRLYGINDDFSETEICINTTRIMFMFKRNNFLYGYTAINYIKDTCKLEVRYSKTYSFYGIGAYYNNSYVINIDAPILDKLDMQSIKDALIGVDRVRFTDGVRIYNSYDNYVKSVSSIENGVRLSHNTENNLKRTVDKIKFSDCSDIINLNDLLSHLTYISSKYGREYVENIEIQFPEQLSKLVLSERFGLNHAGNIKRIGSLVGYTYYRDSHIVPLVSLAERLYAHSTRSFSYYDLYLNRDEYSNLEVAFNNIKYMGDYSLLLDETVILDFKDLDVAFSLDAFFCSRYQDTLIIKSSNKKTIHSLLRSFRAFRDKILNTSVLSKNLVLIVIPDDLDTTYMTTRNISFIKDSEYNKIINKVMKRYENTPKENLTYAYIGKHGHPFDNIIREEFSEYIKPFDHRWSTKSAYTIP